MTRRSPLLLASGALCALGGAVEAASFARADPDHDGFATYQDARRALPLLTVVSFEKFDYDRDGALDRNEWAGLDNFYTVLHRDR